MPTELANFSRQFQIWAYTVGHSQLLLRSVKNEVHPTRIDILFKNVSAIHLPALMDGLTIQEATDTDAQNMRLADSVAHRKLFLLSGVNFSGHVVAGFTSWHEDELAYYDKSYFHSSLHPDLGLSLYSRIYLIAKIWLLTLIHKVRTARLTRSAGE